MTPSLHAFTNSPWTLAPHTCSLPPFLPGLLPGATRSRRGEAWRRACPSSRGRPGGEGAGDGAGGGGGGPPAEAPAQSPASPPGPRSDPRVRRVVAGRAEAAPWRETLGRIPEPGDGGATAPPRGSSPSCSLPAPRAPPPSRLPPPRKRAGTRRLRAWPWPPPALEFAALSQLPGAPDLGAGAVGPDEF